jgi:hypothetical protein
LKRENRRQQSMRKVEGTATISMIVHIQSQQGKTGHLHRLSTEEMDGIGI